MLLMLLMLFVDDSNLSTNARMSSGSVSKTKTSNCDGKTTTSTSCRRKLRICTD